MLYQQSLLFNRMNFTMQDIYQTRTNSLDDDDDNDISNYENLFL